MRTLPLAALLFALLALSPVVPAGYGQGGTVGVNFGFGDAGVWELWYFDAQGGHTGVSVQWGDVRTDYDLYVYPPGSLDDGALDEPPMAWMEEARFGPDAETLWFTDLPPARYVVAVVAHQSTGATYDLYANPGALTGTYPGAVGVRWFCPPAPLCPPL